MSKGKSGVGAGAGNQKNHPAAGADGDINVGDIKKRKRSGFSGQIGFVMAAAGSAVGVGNLWRFPYLAAKDGGGLFILVYLILVVTFGFTLLTSDIAIGRRTKKSSIHAYEEMSSKWKFLGILTFLVPVLIMTYYAVIGGWVTRYALVYLTGQTQEAAADDYFTTFITSPVASVTFALIFMAVTAFVCFKGVQSGIEKVSRTLMPILLLIVVAISIYALTLSHTDESGTTRTGIQGLLVYITPNVEGLTIQRFLQILLDAMSQLFFSLSVSMGIMITYGSYVKDDVNLVKSINQIEILDTGVALLAGLMIIPTIFVFTGTEGMSAGPGLMFVALPKVFASMGVMGPIIGALFFIMTIFATLTSCISVFETIVSNCMDLFKVSRKKACIVLGIIYLAASAIIALGYSVFYVEFALPNGSTGQLLDIMDYISNSFMMPFISLLSTILIGWVIGPKWIVDEMEKNGENFGRKGLYRIMIKYVAPIMMLILFLQSTGLFNRIFG